jgi:hypothetical protein
MKLLNCTALTHKSHNKGGIGFQAFVPKFAILAITLAAFALPSLSVAQNGQTSLASAIEVVRASSQADRVTIITQAMNFSEEDAAAFWPIYRKYERERSELDDRRVAVIKDYAAKYPNLTDAEAKGMAQRMIDCDASMAALKKKYYKNFNAVLPALTVTKFFQLDHRLDLVMDMKVESSLPPLAQPEQVQEEQPSQALQEK